MDPFTQSVLLVCLGAIIALACGLLVEWLRGRSASKLEELRIKADADRISAPAPPPNETPDRTPAETPDRTAAAYVFSVGGKVHVNGDKTNFALLRAIDDPKAQNQVRELVIRAYAEQEQQIAEAAS